MDDRKQLWSPWRLEFIQKSSKAKSKACIFCHLPKKGSSSKNLVLYQSKSAFVIMNRYPYVNGHLMVVPHRHIGSYEKITSEEHGEMNYLMSQSIKILKKCVKAQGFNTGMNLGRCAGAGIKGHVHYHLIPRWIGDSNMMPVIANIRLMPEYLKDTYKRLAPDFNKIG